MNNLSRRGFLAASVAEPSHHGDMSFVLAVPNGVRGHHWTFGNMAPVEGASDSDIAAIIAYVREVTARERHFVTGRTALIVTDSGHASALTVQTICHHEGIGCGENLRPRVVP